ncbi:MAG: glycerate kinase, partial [bacterium]
MKILAAFDSFKESMSAYRAGVAITQAAPDHEVTIIPMADGGEGTMDALQEALEGEIHALYVTGPNFKPVRAKLAICDDLAVIECAMACGLDLLKEAEKDGIHMTTRGVGEMIRYALSLGVKRVLITLGGSATNDGGIGMLSALGIKFYDASHQEVVPYGDSLDAIAAIDCSAYCVPDDVEVIGVCDVSNPLLGKQG